MNRQRHRLVFNPRLGALVAVAECARGRGKSGSGARAAAALTAAALLLGTSAWAQVPVPGGAAGVPAFVGSGQAGYQVQGNQAFVNQVGNKAILNWQSFNLGAQNGVQFRQVQDLAGNQLVPGASFTTLNRIWDINPSLIAGSITQGAGQKANVILVNTNGIAFMGGSQVNLNSFTASTLDIADRFILDNLLPNDGQPQFQGGDGGVVRVLEGAQISATEQGRVMLIAPTVINRGQVSAPGGQVVLAAGNKVFLRTASAYGDSDVRGLLVEVDSPATLNGYDTQNPNARDGELNGQAVALADAGQDKLGHATNLGTLSASAGNVTMVGLAVNQMGIARATSSVVANGSVYLMARDRTVVPLAAAAKDPGGRSQRAGRVVLGEGSRTEVLPEVSDTTASFDGETGEGLARASIVKILGQDVRLESGSTIRTPGGTVDIVAIDDPTRLNQRSTSPFVQTGVSEISTQARVHVAEGARIDVAGLEGIEVSAERNTVAVELRGDELKDSPVNRDGALRGETVYVDVARTLADALAGEPTLIAKDSLEAYAARQARTAAERSTAGGTVNIRSQGETILESGSVVDLSGGSVVFTPATVKTSLLSSAGRLVDVSEADRTVKYDQVVSSFTVDYGRWNVTETFETTNLIRYDPGYTEGKSAGTLNIVGLGGSVLQSAVKGRTVRGELQQAGAAMPRGATLRVGAKDGEADFKLNQRVQVSSMAQPLPASFDFGQVLDARYKDTLHIDPAQFGKDLLAHLEVHTNKEAVVQEALVLPDGGGVQLTASRVEVKADIRAAGGRIGLDARANQANPSSPVDASAVDVVVAPGVHLDTAGRWTNLQPGFDRADRQGVMVDGGSVAVTALNGVQVAASARIDVSAGAALDAQGALALGKAGSVRLQANAGLDPLLPQPGRVEVQAASLSGHGFESGGDFSLSTGELLLGAEPAAGSNASTVSVDALAASGFQNINLSGRAGLTVADGARIAPTLRTLQTLPGVAVQPTGADRSLVAAAVDLPLPERKPVHLALKADSLQQGRVRIGEGASVVLDPGATLEVDAAQSIDVQGRVHAPGGDVALRLGGNLSQPFDASSAIVLGSSAVLDASGAVVTYTGPRGERLGEAFDGGRVSIDAGTGYVISQAGSLIDVSGAAPVRLDRLNEQGGIGRAIGSAAGAVAIHAREGLLLDGSMWAHAGDASGYGGSLSLSLGDGETPLGAGFPGAASVVELAPSVAAQAGALAAGQPVPDAFNGQARIHAARVVAGGFDTIEVRSQDTVRLADGLALDRAGAQPLRSLSIDAPVIESAGGQARLRAHVVSLGNQTADVAQQTGAAQSPVAGTGQLSVEADHIRLRGQQALSGVQSTRLQSSGQIELAGVTVGSARPAGGLHTLGDLNLQASVVSPATFVEYGIRAPGRTVTIAGSGAVPDQPLSAFGALSIEAGDIVQGGRLWAPLGQLALKASGRLELIPGSLSSVSAQAGSVLPFGRVENGRRWTYTADGQRLVIDDLPEKRVALEGQAVDLQAGATVSVAGGGDAQAYEFTVGPGGSQDILALGGTYAILPGRQAGVAPVDAQEPMAERKDGRELGVGSSVYLSGVVGLADGVYTLLPAHYALLPGARAVQLDTVRGEVLPGQGYTRADGVQVAAGYLTDSRSAAPREAQWQGVAVYSREQVRERSEFTLTPASAAFAGSRFAPQDAGRFVVSTTGTGANSLRLDGSVLTAAATGGTGAAVDIAARDLAVTGGGSTAGVPAGSSVIDAGWLDGLNAGSVLLGGVRTPQSDGSTAIDVRSQTVQLSNDATSALRAPEVLLAAKDRVAVTAGSAIDASSPVAPEATRYTTSGNGALLMASAARSDFTRTGSPDRSQGALDVSAGSLVKADEAVVADATNTTRFEGGLAIGGPAGGGSLSMGAARIGFGDAPQGTAGLTFSEAELEALGALDALAFTSYSGFDLYGDVTIGRADDQGRPVLDELRLRGAGLAGQDNVGQTATLRAQRVVLSNEAGVAFGAGAPTGTGALKIEAQSLELGAGSKQLTGFLVITAQLDELTASGAGQTDTEAQLTVQATRVAAQTGADQALRSSGDIRLEARAADGALAAPSTLGSRWAISGRSVTMALPVQATSGSVALQATGGDVTLAAGAGIDVAGRAVRFVEAVKPSAAGTVTLVADGGDVRIDSGATVDVSAAAGGDAGVLDIRATHGLVTVAAGAVQGTATADAEGRAGEGASARVDVGTLAEFSALNAALNAGGFQGERRVRVRSGALTVAEGDLVQAHRIALAADGGALTVAGTVSTLGAEDGEVALHGRSVALAGSARVLAAAGAVGGDGGRVEIGAATQVLEADAGAIDLQAGALIDVSGGAGGVGGELHLRAQRKGSDVAVTHLDVTVTGARDLTLEAVRVYDGKSSLDASATETGTALGLTKMNADNTAYAAHHAAIATRLNQVGNPGVRVASGVEVRSSGDLRLAADWNLKDSAAGGQAGVLTLRAGGNLNIDSNLSDGFSDATPNATTTGAPPATLLGDAVRGGQSWSYKLVAGADAASADPLGTQASTSQGDITVAAGKLVRTGTGNIRMAAGRDIRLASAASAVYTAGKLTVPAAGFAVPSGAQYSTGGGDVELVAQGDIVGAPSAQLYSNWLYRQGAMASDGQSYDVQPAWWVRFDKFQQGVATLGGGNVTLQAGGDIGNVSASAATQGHTTASTNDAGAAVRTGGGSVSVRAGNDVLGGQYYADLGDVRVDAGGAIVSGQTVGTGTSARPLHTILAVGDGAVSASARGAVDIQAILNPHLVVQSSGTGGNIANATSPAWSLFSTYADDSAASLQSLIGDVRLFNVTGSASTEAATLVAAYRSPLNFTISSARYNASVLSVLPPSLSMVAMTGDASVNAGVVVMSPGPQGQLELLAGGDVRLSGARIDMADTLPLPDAVTPGNDNDQFATPSSTQPSVAHAAVPVHAHDLSPVRIEAATGSVSGSANRMVLRSPKAVTVLAAQDVQDFGVEIQHLRSGDVSRIEAGRDIAFSTGESRSSNAYVAVSGPGRLEMTAGGDIRLGTSAGVLSRGTLDNPALPAGGADLQLAAGLGQVPLDHGAVVDRLLGELSAGPVSDDVLWLARWLTGDRQLSADEAPARVRTVAAADPETLRTRVRDMLFTGLRETGRDSNDPSSAFAGQFDRAYRALELVFPGIAKVADGGQVDIFASRIKTEQGGAIEILAPGGGVVVGLSNTPETLTGEDYLPSLGKDAGVLGIVTVGAGDVRIAARDDVLVNQSRVLTAAGGDILIWSSEGDIDAGKGKKTASAVPPPVIKVDSQGNITQELQAAASGSGIGSLSTGGIAAGDVDLIAPKGTVNAGDAGIRAGNLNIAAQVVLGAENISVSGSSSGTPVADTGAVTAASSGATTGGDDASRVVESLNEAAAESAKAAQELASALRPTVVRVDVLGYGE